MKRLGGIVILVFVFLSSEAQLRYTKLLIKKGETFSFAESDILVVDTLVMQDSSRILLNKLKRENYLHTKVAIIGKACVIDGAGVSGGAGRKGKAGQSPMGPCRSGGNGQNGMRGLDGVHGVNLFTYWQQVKFEGALTINLAGGNAGNGGDGGEGGSGGPGTVHCKGGNGGLGGNAGDGANGGNAGLLELNYPTTVHNTIIENLKVINRGGYYGSKGRGGYSGSAGTGPSRNDGRYGAEGKEGVDGISGKTGGVKYVQIN